MSETDRKIIIISTRGIVLWEGDASMGEAGEGCGVLNAGRLDKSL